ncbi:hypothetical protein A3H38_02300 [candidate division WOR-1 bacterium RIFCSPLOWO2_02_FULL_46_20]|uniref:Response regulatory domain-containing protein n=2 Tax=Saganbacteria TaxID=1703751 RepID=A0A1F4R8L3_UNCSA|nr:MAG: hypothetical protein A3J44_05385 [candidate division WOR-1 bacterium RIFCSPHIGHO2_02_FULL_45_12]OGC04517.1 MAG: hypothetical protein A3H38_02300 [candidate division WOR-1 bacterium RIFCSPLOWO2_02_FULL_46_20]OGC09340.1 MAG: hypothetical protein A3F86_00615 [candidate division WOR-1 bacterium RIFCSPLOWO2_12_FULL_45_9]
MSKPMIMVVDDDKGVADEIAETLRETGKYDLITAYSAKEALEHLAKNKIMMGIGGNRVSLIFLDIKMAEMDGLQFLEKIRKDYDESIGVCMLTAYEDTEKWERATSGLVINYLHKPFDEAKVLATADDYFAGKEVQMTLKTFEEHMAKRDEFKKSDKD